MIANSLLLIRPKAFGFNSETSYSNDFQQQISALSRKQIILNAQAEFDHYCEILRHHSIETLVFEDTAKPIKPDAIFPNNWLVCMPNQTLFTFPMEAKNRRIERRTDILNQLSKKYKVNRVLEQFEEQGLFLEGTGSMVIDHSNRMIFAAKSSRTAEPVLQKFAEMCAYHYFMFETTTNVYHTNVIMTISPKFCVICKEIILAQYHDKIDQLLKDKVVMEISAQQMKAHFLGNCLLVKNKHEQQFLILSQTANNALTIKQKELIKAQNIMPLPVPINTIETIGGGSARCMIAELF